MKKLGIESASVFAAAAGIATGKRRSSAKSTSSSSCVGAQGTLRSTTSRREQGRGGPSETEIASGTDPLAKRARQSAGT